MAASDKARKPIDIPTAILAFIAAVASIVKFYEMYQGNQTLVTFIAFIALGVLFIFQLLRSPRRRRLPRVMALLAFAVLVLGTVSFFATPDRPDHLTTSSIGNGIQLNWRYDGSGVDHFAVHRQSTPNAEGLRQVAIVSPDERTFIDNDVRIDTDYLYTVRAVGGRLAFPTNSTSEEVSARLAHVRILSEPFSRTGAARLRLTFLDFPERLALTTFGLRIVAPGIQGTLGFILFDQVQPVQVSMLLTEAFINSPSPAQECFVDVYWDPDLPYGLIEAYLYYAGPPGATRTLTVAPFFKDVRGDEVPVVVTPASVEVQLAHRSNSIPPQGQNPASPAGAQPRECREVL